jgi:hypothetical protein
MVKMLKKLVLGCLKPDQVIPDDDELAAGLLGLRNAPRYGGKSPAELLLGRNVRDMVPTHWDSFDPKWRRTWKEMDEAAAANKRKWRAAYDARAKPLREFKGGDAVWVQDHATKRWTIAGRVVEVLPNHDYLVRQCSGRVFRRNRVLLRKRTFWPGPGPTLTAGSRAPAAVAPTPPPSPAAGRSTSPPVQAARPTARPEGRMPRQPERRSERAKKERDRYSPPPFKAAKTKTKGKAGGKKTCDTPKR